LHPSEVSIDRHTDLIMQISPISPAVKHADIQAKKSQNMLSENSVRII